MTPRHHCGHRGGKVGETTGDVLGAFSGSGAHLPQRCVQYKEYKFMDVHRSL